MLFVDDEVSGTGSCGAVKFPDDYLTTATQMQAASRNKEWINVMFYKIPRNSDAFVHMINGNEETLESKRILIYIDTYISEANLLDEYEDESGNTLMAFMIERNVNECDPTPYEDEDEYADDVRHEVICAYKRYIQIVESIGSDACASVHLQS
jgi:hypothetical protein